MHSHGSWLFKQSQVHYAYIPCYIQNPQLFNDDVFFMLNVTLLLEEVLGSSSLRWADLGPYSSGTTGHSSSSESSSISFYFLNTVLLGNRIRSKKFLNGRSMSK